MSVLVKGMDMPEDCIKCPVCVFENSNWMCRASHDVADFGGICRPPKCPLIEVSTPHGDLIDREELLNDVGGVYTARPEEVQKIQHEINKVLFAIKDAPTVIEAEGK